MIIDLDRPATERWSGLADHAAAARALLEVYQRDLGSAASGLVLAEAQRLLPAQLQLELEGVARAIGASLADVVVCNLYYDLIKAGLGCSAFAVDTARGPLHARNLDWWTTGGLLRDHTLVFDCQRGGTTRYRLVGWPGFIGAFSGVAPGRFSITLNAVLSDDPPLVAEPVVFLLRRVLDECPSFDAALRELRSAPIASDCLLLLAGVRPGEFVVIERTPTRAAVRTPAKGFIEVTNDYRVMDANGSGHGELAASSCHRSERLVELLSTTVPQSAEAAFMVLSDPRVTMSITVQRMVLSAATGACLVALP